MTLPQFLSAISQALRLLISYPLRSLAVALTFLIAVEAFMFIPYLGFTFKIALSGVLGAQALAMFAAAAAGRGLSPVKFLSAFSFPIAAQAALVVGALIPFVAGMLFLYFKAGPTAVEFFFGNIFKTNPPNESMFTQMKYVMQLFALPFTFLAGAVVLKGVSGLTALSTAFAAAAKNWLPILFLGLINLVYEWASIQLPSFLSKPASAIVGGILLLLFIAWSFAVAYTVSAKVFGTVDTADAA